MAKSEKFNASINFGASIDSSLGKSLKWLTSGIQDTEKTTLKAMGVQTKWMRDLQNGSSTTASKMKVMEQSMGALVKKQEALETKIRAGVRAGEDVSKLTDQYKTVAVGISRAEKELERLNAERKKELSLDEAAAKAEAKYQKKWERIERVSKMPGRALSGAGRMLGSTAKWAALGGLGLAGGAIGGGLSMMDKMADELGIAKSTGLTYEKFKAGGILATRAGLNAENFSDLVDELSNKIGEQGNEKTINPMLRQIGMTKSMLARLPKGEQFEKVMQAITSRVRAGGMTKTQAESLGDQLMGGEANKILTSILDDQKTYSEAMKEATRLQNTSNEEAAAAAATARTISDIWISAESALEGVVGEIGLALKPQLKAWEDSALSWIKDNKDVIAKAIGNWASEGGPQRLVDDAVKFGKGVGLLADEIMEAAQRLKWILPDADGVKTQKIQDYLGQQIARGTNPEAAMAGAKSLAESYGVEDWFAAQHYENASNLQMLAGRYRGGETPGDVGYGGFDDSAIGGALPKAFSQDTYHINPTFNITMQPGESTQDVAQNIMDEFNKMVPNFNPVPTFDTY